MKHDDAAIEHLWVSVYTQLTPTKPTKPTTCKPPLIALFVSIT